MDYYAEGRSPAFSTETVQIFSRPAIYQADRTTNEGKIDAMSGTLEIIAEHSNHVSRATSTFKEEVQLLQQKQFKSFPDPQYIKPTEQLMRVR